MMRFIYTGKAPNLEKMADNLLAAADKVSDWLLSSQTWCLLVECCSNKKTPKPKSFFQIDLYFDFFKIWETDLIRNGGRWERIDFIFSSKRLINLSWPGTFQILIIFTIKFLLEIGDY